MRVKSFEQLHSCKVDIVQEEASSMDLADDSPWHTLPGSSSATGQTSQFLPFLGMQFVRGTGFTKRKFPMPTISTTFPPPDNPGHELTENCATLSTLSLEFPVTGHELHPRYVSPLLAIAHKLRIRIRFCNPDVKEIVVNIPVTLFEGSASCDDIPPYYEEIYSDETGRRSRTDSVATLPVYSPKEPQSPFDAEDGTVALSQTALATPAPSSPGCDSLRSGDGDGDGNDASTDWLNHDHNMRAPRLMV
ncbi:protein of unknown function [Taphrina deformans PYCC 5710]|uniref:Uncharacterized protein n=1 Tax=Taphrina deformans (strain PYCC 5710 / ATCC 11124 / CBS 356.35 / IMI 108563 / JCM 9778 / NBRC 8474) TaxID=1097556 RepID=R4XDZ4_TAPDE|nr:protein of unknown function [Taphrina deformans PYCC 5710]|eukprot:CCG84045.1 protein of unknown function [Taphrina deformans PYCC 5710]